MRLITVVWIIFILAGCKTTKQMATPLSPSQSPHVIIYKTKGDYFTKVPIILSVNKKEIVSYPHPTDLIINGELCLPIKLEDGYLLDRRGINLNVAFVSLDYSEFSKLNQPPQLQDLVKMIIDNDPVTEMFDCGLRSSFKNIERELNSKIRNHQLTDFNRLK